MQEIIHFMHNTIIEEKYIEFLNEKFNKNKNLFIFMGIKENYIKVKVQKNIINLFGKFQNKRKYPYLYLVLFNFFKKGRKIILHGLWDKKIILFLFLNPWFLKKTNWVIWGGDLYSYRSRDYSSFKRKIYYKIEDYVKGNMNGYITHIKGDYELVKKWHNPKGKHYDCFMYISNVYKEINVVEKREKTKYIQVGNSADPTNNHIEILEKLEKFKNEDIKLFVPLSYGDKKWADIVIKYGKEKFKDKFIPILDFMKYDDYLDFISKIDIAIFAHNRQQAVGNITSLLSMNKTVYLKSTVTTYDMLEELGIKIGKFEGINSLDLFSKKELLKNKQIIKRRFSKERLKEDLIKIFDD